MSRRIAAAAAPVAVAVALSLAGAAAVHAAPGLELGVEPGRVVPTSETGAWSVTLRLANLLPDTLSIDSLLADVTDLGPGRTRVDTTTHVPLTTRLPQRTIAPGETLLVRPPLLATAENAQLAFRMYVHVAASDGGPAAAAAPLALSATARAAPGELSLRYPSRFLEVGGHRLEYVLVLPESSAGPVPGLLLVHGHGSHARQMLRIAQALAKRGYAVVLASQPGYGLSDGPADFMGPQTMRAFDAVLGRLARTPGVDSTRLGVWGVSRGATVATLLAARHPEIRAVVAQAGIYDLWAAYRGTRIPGIRETIVAEAGADSSAWRARSAVFVADRIHGAVLLLHGEHDRNVPVDQARGFAASLEKRGVVVETRFFPDAEHVLPRADVNAVVLPFLDRVLRAGS